MTSSDVSMDLFSPEDEEWMSRGEYTASASADGAVVANSGGEIRFYLTSNEGRITVSRAERAEVPAVEFEAVAPDDVRRFLFGTIGVDVRNAAGYRYMRLRAKDSDVAPGFETVLFPDGSTGLRRSGELLGLRFRRSYNAVRFSHYAEASPADIRRSFSDPTGEPLFARFTER